MSTVAEAPARLRRKAPPAKRAARRAPFAGGIAWIVLVGVLLAGVVAVNVLVLQLNVDLDRYGRERAELKAEGARLRSELSSASANVRIESDATSKLGLVPADPATTTYVQVVPEEK
jgi:cell division protein FtsL